MIMKKRMLYLILCISILCGILSGCGQLVIRCPKDSTAYGNYVEFYEDVENVSVEIVE